MMPRRCIAGIGVLVCVIVAGCDELDSLVRSAIVESVEVLPDSATVRLGEGMQLSAVLIDDADSTLVRRPNWSSLSPAIVVVDSTGWVVGTSLGVGRVRAEADGRTDVARIRVVP